MYNISKFYLLKIKKSLIPFIVFKKSNRDQMDIQKYMNDNTFICIHS